MSIRKELERFRGLGYDAMNEMADFAADRGGRTRAQREHVDVQSRVALAEYNDKTKRVIDCTALSPKTPQMTTGIDLGKPFPPKLTSESYAEVVSGDWYELSPAATARVAPHAPSARDLDTEFVRELRSLLGQNIGSLEVATDKPPMHAAKAAVEVQPDIFETFESIKVYTLGRLHLEWFVDKPNVDLIRGAFFAAARAAAGAFARSRGALVMHGCSQAVLHRRIDNFFGVVGASQALQGAPWVAHSPATDEYVVRFRAYGFLTPPERR